VNMTKLARFSGSMPHGRAQQLDWLGGSHTPTSSPAGAGLRCSTQHLCRSDVRRDYWGTRGLLWGPPVDCSILFPAES
jgi:hypothetical protein